MDPLRERAVARQVPLDGLAARRLAQQLRVRGGAREHRAEQRARHSRHHALERLHGPSPLRRSRASVGSPRRQNTSGSIASSYAQQSSVACHAVLDSRAQRVEALLDELRLLEVGEIREAQHRGSGAQLGHQQLEARHPHAGASRSEPGSNTASARSRPMTRWIDAPKLNSSALPRVARCTCKFSRRRAVAARQRAVVELQHEVRASALVRRDRARDVEAAELVRRREQAARRREPHLRYAALAFVLQAVAVRVVEDLADDVRAVERGIRNDAHRGRRFARQRAARERAHRLRAVHELAFADAGADGQQQHQRVAPVGRHVETGPRELAARDDGLARLAVEARRAFDVAEARREAVDDGDVGEVHGDAVRDRDHVRHELAARDVDRRRRLRDDHGLVEVEIERDVVVEDLARARHEARVERQVQVIVRAARARRRRTPAAAAPRAPLRSAAPSPARRRRWTPGTTARRTRPSPQPTAAE